MIFITNYFKKLCTRVQLNTNIYIKGIPYICHIFATKTVKI